ncbi:MAG: hypothetical protein CM1200mP3_11520 [Chloroflexota bacterium]|nr:MAG: hypothetical protein CM1200mP3_11520 [Chloroflexota bacterium]
MIGVDGLIIPDLPSEESMTLSGECKNVGIHLIPLLAPTSTEERKFRLHARLREDSFTVLVLRE